MNRVMSMAACLAAVFTTPVLGQVTTERAAVPTARHATPAQRAWLDAPPERRVRLAEQLGEEGAQAFAAKNGYQPLLTKADRSLPQGFDQVYRAKDGTIVVIEAKGGTSAIGRAYGCPQGTPEWAVQAAKRVAKSAKASLAEKQAAKLVLDAARDGKLIVLVVRTRHVLGEPVVAVLESTLRGGQAESKAAATILEEMAVATKATPAAGLAAKAVKAPSKAAAGASTLSKVGKAVGAVGITVGGLIRVKSAVETEKEFQAGKLTSEERVTAHVKNAAGMVGGLGGAWAGAKGGAAAGGAAEAFFGGIGAPIGAVIGGGIGAVGGYFGGEFLTEKLVDGISSFWR